MNTQRKNYREVQMQKQLDELRAENARLKDCVLLQQKIIEKQKKQKQILEEEYRLNIEEPYYLRKTNRSKKNLDEEQGSQRLIKCLTSRDFFQDNSLQFPKNQKLASIKKNSNKTAQDPLDQALKKKRQKKTVDFKGVDILNVSSSSTNLFDSLKAQNRSKRKSYLQKLAEQLNQ